MYQKTEVKLEPLTLELAKETSTMQGLPGERELKATRVSFLYNHVKQGSFVGPSWAIAVCRTTGERYRINGQHSSNMLAGLTPESFPPGLLVTIEVYEFDSMADDGPGLFNLFDHPKSARTDTDYMGILQAQFPDLSELSKPFLMKVSNGITQRIRTKKEEERKLRESGARPEDFPAMSATIPTEILAHRDQGAYFAFDGCRQFALWLHRWHEAKHAAFINRAGIVAEILDDWEQSPEIATEFWDYVLHFNHPEPNHETRELAETLKAMFGKPKAKQADFQQRAKRSWSRYRRLRAAESRAAASKKEPKTAASDSPAQEGSVLTVLPPPVPVLEMRPQA